MKKNILLFLCIFPIIAENNAPSKLEYLKSKLPPKRALFTGICGIALIAVGIKTIKERNINSQHFDVLANAVKGSTLADEYQQIASSLRSSAILYGSFNIAAGLVVIYDAWQHMKNSKNCPHISAGNLFFR